MGGSPGIMPRGALDPGGPSGDDVDIGDVAPGIATLRQDRTTTPDVNYLSRDRDTEDKGDQLRQAGLSIGYTGAGLVTDPSERNVGGGLKWSDVQRTQDPWETQQENAEEIREDVNKAVGNAVPDISDFTPDIPWWVVPAVVGGLFLWLIRPVLKLFN